MVKTENIQLVPKLRFSEFEGTWEKHRLGNIGEFKNGLNKDKEDFGFGSPFINLMDVFGKCVIEHGEFGLVNANEKDLRLYDLQKGDILFIRSSVKRTGVGEAVLVLQDLPNTVYSGFLIRFREYASLMNLLFKKFCFATIRFRKELLSYATTSANTNINQECLSALKLFLPTLHEQEKIASFLSAIDKKIQQLAAKKELLEQYKKGVMQKIFSRQIRFTDDNGKDYPDWEEKKLGEVMKLGSGGTPSKQEPSYWGNDIPWISASSMQGHLFSESKLRITELGLSKGSKLAKKGTILLLVRGSMLYNKIPVGIAERDVAFNQDVKSIIPKFKTSSEFLLQWFLAKQNLLLSMVVGTGIGAGKLDTHDLKRLQINLPILPEQQKIASCLSSIDKKIESVQSQLTQTQTFKKGLLLQLFV